MAQNTQAQLAVLLNEIAKRWGAEIGAKIREEIEALVEAQNLNLEKVNQTLDVIKSLLDADPDTPEFDVGQNIIRQLTDILTRLEKAETRLDNVESTLETLTGDENTEGSIANVAKNIATEVASEVVETKVEEKIQEQLNIDLDSIFNTFKSALECGLSGEEDCLNDNGGSSNNSNSANTGSASNNPNGDGAVL